MRLHFEKKIDLLKESRPLGVRALDQRMILAGVGSWGTQPPVLHSLLCYSSMRDVLLICHSEDHDTQTRRHACNKSLRVLLHVTKDYLPGIETIWLCVYLKLATAESHGKTFDRV